MSTQEQTTLVIASAGETSTSKPTHKHTDSIPQAATSAHSTRPCETADDPPAKRQKRGSVESSEETQQTTSDAALRVCGRCCINSVDFWCEQCTRWLCIPCVDKPHLTSNNQPQSTKQLPLTSIPSVTHTLTSLSERKLLLRREVHRINAVLDEKLKNPHSLRVPNTELAQAVEDMIQFQSFFLQTKNFERFVFANKSIECEFPWIIEVFRECSTANKWDLYNGTLVPSKSVTLTFPNRIRAVCGRLMTCMHRSDKQEGVVLIYDKDLNLVDSIQHPEFFVCQDVTQVSDNEAVIAITRSRAHSDLNHPQRPGLYRVTMGGNPDDFQEISGFAGEYLVLTSHRGDQIFAVPFYNRRKIDCFQRVSTEGVWRLVGSQFSASSVRGPFSKCSSL